MSSSSWNRSLETIDSLSIRSRSIAERTSWSVTSVARTTTNPENSNASAGSRSARSSWTAARRRICRPRRLVERRRRTESPHLEEARVELDPEVPLETGLGVARRQDHRVVDVQRHAVVGAEDGVVGVEEAAVGDAFAAHVHQPLDRALGIQQEAAEVRGRVDGAQLEGDGGGHVVPVPGAGREDVRHQHRDQLVMLLDDRQVVDPPAELRRGLEASAHGAGDVARDAGLGGRGFPRGDQRVEAQLAPVGERRRRQRQLVAALGR